MKPGKIRYNFSELDKDLEFQKFLDAPRKKTDDHCIDIEKYKKGIRLFNQQVFKE